MFRLINAQELTQKVGGGTLARLRPVLAANANPLVSNATLRKDEWEQIDARVNDVMRERLTIVDDIRARGLVTPVGLGTMLRVTERLDEFGDATVSYDGETGPARDRPSFQQETIPVPVIAHEFKVNWRQLEASRTRGEPLDVTGAAQATRKVRDKLQDLFVNGFSYGPDGNSIPGLTTATNRQTVSLATDWDDSGGDPVADTVRMLEAAYAVNLFGPFYLYVPKNYWAMLQEDYSTSKGDRTYMERLMAFEDIASVRPLDTLSDDNVTMVQMTEDVIDMSEAQAVTTVQWQQDPFVTVFRVLAIAGPHIKSIETASGTTINGIVHLS